MKFKRSERLVDITFTLINQPRKLIPFSTFSDRYKAAKSSISEDVAILKQTFEAQGLGRLQTTAGAAGGVRYDPDVSEQEALDVMNSLCETLAKPGRLLPGGYLYLTDIVGDPTVMQRVGRMIAGLYMDRQVDVVMTVATKGISLAYAIAKELGVPVVVVRRDSKVTEGSTVSINYVSGSAKRIQTMVLSKRSLSEGAKVLVVDDFMKAGGTVRGMKSLLDEFQANMIGIAVLVEAEHVQERLVDDYISVVKLSNVSVDEQTIQVHPGNYMKWRKGRNE
ncbi:pur operon repressor [Bacillus fonticola]|uniref:pur operon repressor n=1 Tax=Bacillus fonticola TaxID=2728853 RepID=UPI0014726FB5|nr:pur operon repressor [Bacillus fonticola]